MVDTKTGDFDTKELSGPKIISADLRNRSIAAVIDGLSLVVFKYLLFLALPTSKYVMVALQKHAILASLAKAGKSNPAFRKAIHNAALADRNVLINNLTHYALALLVTAIILSFMLHKKGGSPGKLLLGIIVIDSETGNYLSIKKAFQREFFGKVLSILPLGFGFTYALLNPENKTFHDILFKTRVIKGP